MGLAEVPEDRAPEPVGRIYADIRRVTGEPGVNLVYRHLATLPGALEWAWSSVRPLFLEGALDAAARAAAQAAGTALEPRPRARPRSAPGLSPGARARVGEVLGFYARANPRNLVALGVLGTHLAQGLPPAASAVHRFEPAGETAVPPGPALPSLVRVEAMDPVLRARVEGLASLMLGARPPILPSVLRHLAHWPAFLEAAHAALASPARDGRLAAAAEAMAERARAEAGALARARTPLSPPPALDRARRRQTAQALDTFAAAIPPVTAAVLAMQRLS